MTDLEIARDNDLPLQSFSIFFASHWNPQYSVILLIAKYPDSAKALLTSSLVLNRNHQTKNIALIFVAIKMLTP